MDRGRSNRFVVAFLAVLLCFLIAMPLSLVLGRRAAQAAPVLSVTTSGGKVLLGGNATVGITVQNTSATDRGFNLSLSGTFSSDPLRFDGRYKTVTFVSASGPDGPLTPTSVTTDPVTNELTVRFDDIRDLAPTETTTIDITVSPTDPLWEVGDKIIADVTAEVNTVANGSGATISGGPVSSESELVPIKMITKSAGQTTADTQATGCGELPAGGWPYTYTIEVQNNYVNPTDNVLVTDDVPDGVEYLGISFGPAPDVDTRDADTGIRHLEWNVGDMTAGASWTVTYNAGIRYDYFGYNNSGTNRPYDDFSGAPDSLGAPVEKNAFTNTADLEAIYESTPVSDSDTASVTGSYAAINKSVSPTSVGNGDTVTFTITIAASEYYNILQDGTLLLTDTLPDGFTFDDTSATPAPSDWSYDAGTGVTTIEWDQTAFAGVAAGDTAVFFFDATVNNAWVVPPDASHLLIVAGDSMTNDAAFDATWHDTVDARRPDDITSGNASASTVVVGPKPTIIKQISLDGANYFDSVEATVGDTLYFRVWFNTDDGSTPLVSGVNFGNVDVVDWFPLGTALVTGSATFAYSDAGDFSYDPPVVKYSARYGDQPEAVASGNLDGAAWSLGDVAQDGWWEVVFQVVVQDDAANIVDGNINPDFGKLSWANSESNQFSDRDIADVVCTEPDLTAAKSVISTPANPGAGQDWGYRITLTNTGTAAARNVLVTDTLPSGMRNYDPTTGTVTVTRGAMPLTLGTDYTLDYTPATGVFLIDFDNGGAIHTEIQAPPSADSVVTIDYTARVDSTVGAGASLTNNVSVTWSAQNAGVTPNRDYGPVTANRTITLPSITIAKSIVGTDTVPIGTGTASQVTYRLTVTVPANNLATGTEINRLRDFIRQDGLEYVTGSTLLTDAGGTPPTPALFSSLTNNMNPSISWTSPNPGSTLTWAMRDLIDNSGQATDYVFQVDFKLLATGLITPVSQLGSATDPANWRFWPNTGGNPTLNNTANNDGDFRWSDSFQNRTATSNTTTTTLQQPYMELSKSNDKESPPVFVKAGDTVDYTLTAHNAGTSASYDNIVVDTLPVGLRDADPSGTVAVTVNGLPAAFTTGWNGATGTLTVTVNAGVSVPAGQDLVVTYTATVDGDVGSGATLTNDAYVDYRSESGAGRHVTSTSDSSGSNLASSVVRTPQVTATKTALDTPATIGDTVSYEIEMTVPAGTIMYDPSIVDVIDQDGIEYVPGSSALSRVSGPDPGPALSFIDAFQPSTDYDTPDPGATFTWLLNDVDNSGGADFTFKLTFDCVITGLIDPAGSSSDPDNWVWWWTHGSDPTADNTADDTATIDWSDGVDDHSASTPAATQHVYQPNLDLTKDNDTGGSMLPGGTIGYTISIANNGLGISYENIFVDTLPAYMSDTDPSSTVVAVLDGTTLTAVVDYTVYWAGGQLTVDLTAGSGGAKDIPAGQTLVVTYTGTVNSQVGAGAALTNIASVEFNSRSDGTGRQVPLSTDVSQHNTDDSTADIPLATIAKSQDATGDLSAIGQPYTYAVDVTVPAHTTVYNAVVTDDIADGLAVDGYSTYVDGVSQAVGAVTPSAPADGPVTVTWDMGDYTNNTGADQVVSLGITVHIRTNYDGGGEVYAGATFTNAAELDWDDAETGEAHHAGPVSADTVTATEPDLTLTKINDAAAPIPGGQTVHYILTAENTGTSASCQNVLTDTLPATLRNVPPVVTNVTLAGVPLTENTDFWVIWNSGTGELTIDLDHGVSKTNIQPGAGNRLIVYVNVTPSAVVGAGTTLTNSAIVAYNSWSGSNGRSYSSTPATSSITIRPATMAKAQDAPSNRANIGQPFTYTISVSVPAYTTLYSSAVTDNIVDGLAVDSMATYVDGSPQTVGTLTPAAPFNGPAALTWNMGDYTNNTSATQSVQLRLNVHIRTTYAGGGTVLSGAIFGNSASLAWAHGSTSATAANIVATAPNLAFSKSNDASGPVVGGQPVRYTLTASNAGTGTSYQNVVTDTLPVGMRGNTPVVNSVRLSGLLLTENVNYTVSWNSGTGALVVDLTAGSAGPTNIPSSGSLVVRYTASASDDADPGATLTNSAVVAYNSWSGSGGRASTSTPATSSVTVQAVTMTKTHNAAGNQASIGQPYAYTVAVAVPAHTTLQGATMTDNIADGLSLDSYATYVDGVAQAVGLVAPAAPFNGPAALTWTVASYTNSTDATQQVQLRLNVHIRTTYAGGGTVPSGAIFGNSANLAWAHGSTSATAPNVIATAPNLTFTKANDASGPVVGGQPVHYTLTAANTGNGTSYQNVVTDTLPVGMRGNTPVVTSVTRGGITLTENVNYTVSWNSGTGALVVDLTAGSAGPTNIQPGPGNNLVIRYTASASDDAGAGATLTNSAITAYNSWSVSGGRSYTTSPATSSITVSAATATKTQDTTGDASAIGQPFYYTVGLNVPSRTTVYSTSANDIVPDGLEVTGTSTYVDGIPWTIGTVSVTPNPVDGTTVVAWTIGDYTNITSATQQIQLRIDVRVKTTFNDGTTPVSGLPPQSTFDNTADIAWADAASGGATRHLYPTAPTVTATEPHLVLTEANDAAGPVTGNTPIHYTVTVANDGTSTSYQNQIVQTFPVGMRGNTPTVTGVNLGGSVLTEGLNYTVGWDPVTGELTIDLTAGSDGPTNIPVGSDLVIYMTQSPSPDAGASAVLTDITSIGYNSWSGMDGRQTDRTLNPADDNTDSSFITMQAPTFTSTQDTGDDTASIGQPYSYYSTITLPSYETLYNGSVSVDIPDGLIVDDAVITVDGVPVSIGTITPTIDPVSGRVTNVTWTWDEYTNNTGASQEVALVISVHPATTYGDGSPLSGLPPTQATFPNTAYLSYDDAATGGTTHNLDDSAPTVTAIEPHLTLTEANDAAGPVTGNTPIHYTVTVTNDGTGTSYQNVIVQTFPVGMRGNTPTVTSVTLGGASLTEGVDYWTSWNATTGEFTIDLDHGTSVTNIPAGSDLVVYVAQSPSPDAGASAVLTDITSIGYNSWSGTDGRQTDRTLNPADDNTDSSFITMQAAVIAKTEDAAGDITTIGNTYTYKQTVTVPAYTSIYNAQTADTIPDGLTVTDNNPSVGWTTLAENPSTGEWYVFWNIVDYTNDTANPVDLTLTIDVRVDRFYNDGTTEVVAGDVFSNTASLAWDDADTGGTTHNDSGSAPDITVREPDLAMTKAVDNGTPEAGDTLTYTIEVTNNGGWPACNVTVEDTIDTALAYVGGSITGPGGDASGDPALTWDIQGGLGRGIDPLETVTLTFQAKVKGGAGYGQVVGNTAGISTYDGGQPDPYGRTYGPVSASRSITCRAAVLEMAKTVTAGANPDWGDTVTYQLTVSNNGDADAVNVGVRDTIPSPYFSYVSGSTSAAWPGHAYTTDPAGAPGPGLDWDIGATLAPTESLVLTFDMSVDQWADDGVQTNTGTAYGEDAAGTALTESTGTADIDVQQHPGVGVAKVLDDADGYVPVGDTFTYTITVTDTGNTDIPVVPLTDTYDPAYLGFVSATVTPDATAPGSLTWNDLGPLEPQGTVEVTVTFEALQPGSTTGTDNAAAVDTVDEFSNPVTASFTNQDLVITDPRIITVKTIDGPDGYVPVGGTVSYTVRVTNDGDTVLAAPVRLTDTYNPAYLGYAGAVPAPSSVTAGTLRWSDVSGGAGMTAGTYVDVTVTFITMKAGTAPSTSNTVDVSAVDVHGAPVSDGDVNAGLTITNPELAVAKTVKSGQASPVRVGDTASFIITVTNSGDTAIPAPVHLADTYDRAYLSYQGATPASDDTVDDGSLYWTDITGGSGLAVGASASVEVDFTTLKKGTTSDTATVSGVVDTHGDPIATVESSASVEIGKILGANSWFLAEGSTGGGFDTWVLLENPGLETANVDVTFTTREGPRPPLSFTLGAESRSTVRIQDYIPDDFHVSTFVEADRPIVAERSMYWDKRYWGTTSAAGEPQPYEMKAGHANLGTPLLGTTGEGYDLPTSMYFPEGSTAPGFDTWVLIANPNDGEATVKIRLMTATGPRDAGSVKVPAQSRYTVHLNELLPGEAELATELTSDLGIVAERSMYWDPNAQALQPYEMRGGSSSPGSAELSRDWYIAEGSTGGGFDTYISIQNPGSAQAEVTADFLSTGGVAASKTISMPAGTRATLRIQDYVPDNFYVATQVTADQPVSAERSMYWDKRVTSDVASMQEGHSATGVLRTGTLWTVPEGSTGGGFDSWVLIANPTAVDTPVTVTFMTATGPTAPVEIVVPANSRYTIRVSDYVPDNFYVATTVETEGQIVVERAMYWDRRVAAGIQPYEMMGGHSAVGVDP